MMTVFAGGVVIGVIAGAGLVFSILKHTRKRYTAKMQEPTTLLTVGGVVRWQGEAFVIERFAMGKDNQTDAVITNDHATLCVPVEELEAVRE